MTFHDRTGKRITPQRYAELIADNTYRTIVETTPHPGTTIKTLWEGIHCHANSGAMYCTGITTDHGANWRTLYEDAETEDEAHARHHQAVTRALHHPHTP